MRRILPFTYICGSGLWVLLLLPTLAWSQASLTPNRVDNNGLPTSPVTATRPANPHNDGETEVNILGSYYEQDGNHGAVEGGIGTQHLTDVSPTIILNVPVDSVTRISANLGMDYYASASTDKIDQIMSSPSSSDTRYHVDLGVARQLPDKRTIVGLGGGFSTEYDYLSYNITGSWSQASKNKNRELSVSGQVFFDRTTLITPAELRPASSITISPNGHQQFDYGTSPRKSYNLNIVYSQVISKRMQVALSTELIEQNGYLSTPFHRVYFKETGGELGQAKTEFLPTQRYKYPFGFRLTYFATDLVQLRGFYRFYNDNWGIQAHTFELETPVKITPFFVVYPFYRYHTQTASTYFAPYLQHSVTDAYYTSDYDLSGFSANKVGLGFRYSPVYGIGRFMTPFKGKVAKFKSLDLRYAYYKQSTGMHANVVSFDLAFTMP